MLGKARQLAFVAPVALALGLTACGDDSSSAPIVAAPSPSPSPSPSPTPTSFNVQPCLDQVVPGTTATVASLVVPDMLTIDLAGASGFPNGRRLPDPVIDVTLNVLFLKLSINGPTTLAFLPVNPPANDMPFRTTFPYLAPAQGSPPLSATTGVNFDFRTDPVSAYTRVDRMGMPAVATALIGSSTKNAYNDANPADDAAGMFVPSIKSQLTALTNALADDFQRAGLTVCATPI
ncbi:DUF4331 domain-containing protein [Sphingomonas antarctica]|uniref:DUF4331 family protein n=1 Tax=Sphingomonas antarctica TaxID=2040274 RepID=UPI0039EA1F57